MDSPRSEGLTWAAFAVCVVFGGLNTIGVRFTVMELAPFWGAAIRFIPAAALLFLLALIQKLPLPKGRGLVGAALFGILNFGISFIFLYWGLRQIQAGLATVILALGPLLTLLLAVAHRQETMRWPALIGSLLSVSGVALVFLQNSNNQAPLLALLAVFLGALCLSESSIIIKKYPQSHPVTTNAIGMAVGGAIHLVVSLLAQEQQVLPARPATWAAILYLIALGSCALFILVIYILKRWPASRTAYILVLMPFVALPVSAVLDQEQIGWAYLAGVALVLAGVYVGAIAPQRKAVLATD
jgi:drug/metabolite transporter (DMT)-like permease